MIYTIIRAHECDEPVGYNPVHIAVFDFLLLEVEFSVKVSVVVPSQFARILQPIDAVFKSAFLLAVTHVRITERGESRCQFGKFEDYFLWFMV